MAYSRDRSCRRRFAEGDEPEASVYPEVLHDEKPDCDTWYSKAAENQLEIVIFATVASDCPVRARRGATAMDADGSGGSDPCAALLADVQATDLGAAWGGLGQQGQVLCLQLIKTGIVPIIVAVALSGVPTHHLLTAMAQTMVSKHL